MHIKIYDIAEQCGLIEEENDISFMSYCSSLGDLEKFAEIIIDECVRAIDYKMMPGDLSERAQAMRNAKNAIREYWK